MAEPQESDSNSTLRTATAFVAGLAVGLAAGYYLGRNANPDPTGQLPCPPCVRYNQSLAGGALGCFVKGQISKDWNDGPLFIPDAIGDARNLQFGAGQCFNVPVACPSADSQPVQFRTSTGSNELGLPVDNPLCSGPDCSGALAELCPEIRDVPSEKSR